MISFNERLNIDLLILDLLERYNITDNKELEAFDEEIHEILANIIYDFAYDNKIENFVPCF